jgi:hypothetical protein
LWVFVLRRKPAFWPFFCTPTQVHLLFSIKYSAVSIPLVPLIDPPDRLHLLLQKDTYLHLGLRKSNSTLIKYNYKEPKKKKTLSAVFFFHFYMQVFWCKVRNMYVLKLALPVIDMGHVRHLSLTYIYTTKFQIHH